MTTPIEVIGAFCNYEGTNETDANMYNVILHKRNMGGEIAQGDHKKDGYANSNNGDNDINTMKRKRKCKKAKAWIEVRRLYILLVE